MTNRKNWLGILVITLVLGMMVVGCDDDPKDDGDGGGGGGGSSKTDPVLNGTWDRTTFDGEVQTVTFNNGNYIEARNGTQSQKGTYTTSDNKITKTPTHLYNTDDSKWYSKAETKKYFKSYYKSEGIEGITDDYIDILIDSVFVPTTYIYSVSNNTLTITSITSIETYTKK
jgi:hypothetical protein